MKPVTNEQLRGLLLGHLPSGEAARVEEAILTEEGVAERLREEEFDLIDDYVRGKLTETERTDMERHVLTDSERVGSVRIARALAAQRPADAPASRLGNAPRKRSRLLAVGALLAAGLAAIVVIPRWTADLGAPEVRGGVPSSRVAPDTGSSVVRLPNQTITLLADTQRGASIPVVHLGADAVTVRLQAEAPAPSRDALYSLRVNDASGVAVFQRSGLPVLVSGPYTFVEAAVPAEVLGMGIRTIVLTADGAAGANLPEYGWRINTVRDGAGAAQTK